MSDPKGQDPHSPRDREGPMSTRSAEAPLVVSTDGTAGPYIIVAADQLGPVVHTLRDQSIPLQVDDEAVMLDGRPALMVIDLGQDADVERVQGILDRLSADARDPEAIRTPRVLNRN